MVPARLAEKMSVMSVGTSPFSAHRTIAARSGGARSPARFAPPRGRGGDRSVPRGCPEPAAPLGPAGGAGSAHPLRTRRLGRGARGGLGLRLACRRYLLGSAGTTDVNQVVAARLAEQMAPAHLKKKGYQIHTLPMLLEQVGMMAQKIGKCFLEPPTASPRRSDRANASGTGAEAFSAMKLRPFPARISETVRNIDRAR